MDNPTSNTPGLLPVNTAVVRGVKAVVETYDFSKENVDIDGVWPRARTQPLTFTPECASRTRQAFTDTARSIDELQLASRALHSILDRMNAHSRLLEEDRNVLGLRSGMLRLPRETLSHIFALSESGLALSRVCSAFREVALDTP